MRLDKFTTKFQMALADAQSLAIGRENPFLEPVHLLFTLINQEGGSVAHIISNANPNPNVLRTIRSELNTAMDSLPQVEGTPGEFHYSNDITRLFNVCDKLAQQKKDQFISSELFLLALIDDKTRAGEILRKAGGETKAIEKAINEVRGGQTVKDPNAEEQRQALEKYTIDLTERAEQGKLDPCDWS